MYSSNRLQFIKEHCDKINLSLQYNTLCCISKGLPYKQRNQLFYKSLNSPIFREQYLEHFNRDDLLIKISKINMLELLNGKDLIHGDITDPLN